MHHIRYPMPKRRSALRSIEETDPMGSLGTKPCWGLGVSRLKVVSKCRSKTGGRGGAQVMQFETRSLRVARNRVSRKVLSITGSTAGLYLRRTHTRTSKDPECVKYRPKALGYMGVGLEKDPYSKRAQNTV